MVFVLLTGWLRISVGLFHHVLVYIRDLHLVYPGCWHFENGSTSNMVDSPMSFLLLPTWNLFGWTSRGNHSKMFLLIEFFLVGPLLKCQPPETATGKSRPRLCSAHFSPSDIIVTERSTKLKNSALPIRHKSQSSDFSKDILLVSRDGVQFPSNSSILASWSFMIRHLLGDCPSEETTIIMHIESTILDTVLELHDECNPLFPSRLYKSVKQALEVFQVEQFVLVEEIRSLPRKFSKPRKNRIISSLTVENIEIDNIDWPYSECVKTFKGRNSFLNHLCVVDHKNELESKIIKLDEGKFKCPQDGCNLELDSKNKCFGFSHFGIRKA